MPSRRSTRALAVAVVGVLLLTACGGSDGDGAAADDDVAEPGAPAETAAESASDTTSVDGVDLGGADVDPASEIDSNLFPDLVVDDVTREKKVNLRNVVPSDKPVLLWMWAPH
jgi:ABC-type Fe3+-citrate transport system substrate-binding protein